MRPVDGPAEPASLVFRAGSLRCALRLDEVIETMRPLPTRPLAGTPPFVLGISVLRGVPTPVIDVARLLDGGDAEVSRFIAVRTERGPTAFAIGDVLGIRSNVGDTGAQHPAVLASAPNRLVAGIGTVDAEPLLLLQSMRVVSDDVWAAAAAAGMPS
jgi:purine-binding chemotaxis protein CheW